MANKGKRFTPHLLKSFKNSTVKIDSPIDEQIPIELKDPNNWDIINEAMRQTADKSHFTDASYTAAMKTGTAQVFSVGKDQKYNADTVADHLRENALVVAYAPYGNSLYCFDCGD